MKRNSMKTLSMALKIVSFLLHYFITIFLLSESNAVIERGGKWVLLRKSVGISAMHMQLLHNNKVVMFDRTDFGPSNLSLPAGNCRTDKDEVMKVDCTAHSLLYDVATNTFRPLTVQTDVWCSSGAAYPNGTLVQTGGYHDGAQRVRLFSPCDDDEDQCDWIELPQNLTSGRWYSSDQTLPDGRVIIVGGRDSQNYEFFPKDPNDKTSMTIFNLQFLKETLDSADEENNLYPFLHLMPDGNLFLFANNRSMILDYVNNRIVREFPQMPGGEKRNYPSTGSSVMLPLHLTNNTPSPVVEVLICGGARRSSFGLAEWKKIFSPASKTCGRIKLTDPNPQWVMEEMPMRRVMPDMLLLPTGDVIIINGAQNGTAGWDCGEDPALNPVIYVPEEADPTRRFAVLNPATIPRMYHSSAILLPDGRILVGGSNPHALYDFTGVRYPTELSLEAFMPDYMSPQHASLRPTISSVAPGLNVTYGQKIFISYTVDLYRDDQGITVTMIAPSFTTHSFSMNQRLLVLEVINLQKVSSAGFNATVLAPPTANIAPPGYYMLFVVNDGVPGLSIWIKIDK